MVFGVLLEHYQYFNLFNIEKIQGNIVEFPLTSCNLMLQPIILTVTLYVLQLTIILIFPYCRRWCIFCLKQAKFWALPPLSLSL